MTAPAKHSRRDVLKKSAVAGAVFWAVPVIESVTSRASASSGVCRSSVTFTSSWIYVVWTYGGMTYFTGYTQGDSSTECHGASNPHGASQIVQNGSTYYQLENFTGGPATGDLRYTSTESQLLTAGTKTTYSGSASSATFLGCGGSGTCTCPASAYLSFDGNGTVTPNQSGVTIVAAFCWGGNINYPQGVGPDSAGCVYGDQCS